MNKNEFERKFAEENGKTYKETREWCDAIFDAMAKAMTENDSMYIFGLGKFEHVQRAARSGRNATTGERIPVPAHMEIKFKPAEAIFDAVASEKLH